MFAGGRFLVFSAEIGGSGKSAECCSKGRCFFLACES